MSIVFQQPDPVAPGLSAAQGFASTYAQMFPAIAHLYGQVYNTQAQAQMQNAQQTQNAQQFQAAQQNQAALQTQQLQAQADQSQYQATQASQLQDQKAQNEAWLNQQALSQSDQMQQTRLQNHLSWLQGGEAQDNLTPDQIQGEMNDTIQKLSYFQQRSNNATMNGIQQQGTLAGHVNAQGLTRQMADMKAQSQQLADMIVEKKLSNGGTVVMTPDGKGGWKETHMKPGEDTGAQDALKQQKAQQDALKTEMTHVDTDSKHYQDAYVKAEGIVKSMSEKPNADKTGLMYPNLSSQEKADWNGRQLTPYQANILDHMNSMGFPPDKSTYLEQKRQERAALRQQMGLPALQQQSQPQPGNVATPAQQQPKTMSDRENVENQGNAPATPRVARTEQPPFKFDKGDKTQAQTETVSAFNQYRKNISDSNLWNTNRNLYNDAHLYLSTAQGLLEKFGSEQGMPKAEKKLYDDSISLYRQVVGPALAQQAKVRGGREENPEAYGQEMMVGGR